MNTITDTLRSALIEAFPAVCVVVIALGFAYGAFTLGHQLGTFARTHMASP